MKKTVLFFISIFWLGNLSSQNWVNVIDSMPNSHPFIYCSVVDTINNLMYIGGDFQQINNLKTKGIVKYDGVKFDTLGAGLDPQWAGLFTTSQPKKLIMFQNKLYVTGNFERAGKYYTPNLARWNGTSWDSTDFKLRNSGSVGTAWHMDVYNNELYVAGGFDSIGGIKCNNFAKFDGVSWHDIGYPYNTCVTAIANYNGKLYMSGEVSSGSSCANLAYYDGISWHPWAGVYGNVNKGVFGMKVIDSMLYVYGRFYSIGGTNCMGLAAWNGTKWFGFGKGVGVDGTIWNVSKFNGEIYVNGIFDSINDLSSSNGLFNFYTDLAKFDGTKWCTFMEPFNNTVSFTTEYNNELYMGGAYLEIGSHTPAMPLTKWIGGSTSVNCGANIDAGLNEYYEKINFLISPNPTKSIINIIDEQNQLQNSTIEITNALGEVVFSSSFSNQIDISHLQSGMYFLTVQDNSKKKTVKIIKQ